MATKGYGFTVDDIDWSCPTDLEPYAKAHNEEVKEKDTLNWFLGQYFASALDSTVCNSWIWRKKGSKPHEYIKKPILQQVKEKEYEKKQDRPEYKGMSDEEKQKAELERAKDYFNSLMARF